MSYRVYKETNDHYGNIIIICLDQNGEYDLPFDACQKANEIKILWNKEDKSKIRFLINGQVMTKLQAYEWSQEEYKSLPKCFMCASILKDNIYIHSFCKTNLFCSQACADKDYLVCIDKQNEAEECDYL